MKKKRVSVGIPAEDLKIGDYVAIVEPDNKTRAKIVMGRDEDGDPMIMQVSGDPTNLQSGIPHKVLGISWPWAVFGVLMPGGGVDGPVIRDLRKIICMRLEKGYVDAIKVFEKPETDNTNEISIQQEEIINEKC